jgi:hypothetical protein
MKKYFFIISALTVFIACRQEKIITSKDAAANKPLLKSSEQTAQAPSQGIFQQRGINLFAPSASGRSFSNPEVIKELMEKNVPLEVPSAACPDWFAYRNIVEANAAALSTDARLYCSATLISAFGISSSPYSSATAVVVKPHLDELVARRYANYKVLYEMIQWFRQGGENDYAEKIRNRTLIYAKPLLPPPNPNRADSPELASNPAFKAEMHGIIERMKENDSYIDKLKTL